MATSLQRRANVSFYTKYIQYHLNEQKTSVNRRSFYDQRKSAGELFPSRLSLPENHGYVPTLSPPQVSSLFSINELSYHARILGSHVIRGFDSNILPSNHPTEDRRAQAHLLQTPGKLFAVYDGHSGCACAQALTERLFQYIAVSIMTVEQQERFVHALRTDSPMDIVQFRKHDNEYMSEALANVYRSSLQKYVIEMLSTDPGEEEATITNAMIAAFNRLDTDICVEPLPESGIVNADAVDVSMSGACALVAHIDGPQLTIANSGDCRAVMGSLTDDNHWQSKALSVEHNSENKAEVERVKNSHPVSESHLVLKNNRLLGNLIPLRAFGDAKYKWSLHDMKTVVGMMGAPYSSSSIPQNYYTPPYLTVTPDITQQTLQPNDKFLILATDGLWDMMSADKAVQLVGQYLEGRETQGRFKLKDGHMKLGSINDMLIKRKSGIAQRSIDDNVASHLIRHALGYEHRRVSEMLTLPPEVSRYYRDDITVTVIFFDGDFLQKNSP